MSVRTNALNQDLDIKGSLTKNPAKTLTHESAGLGQPLVSQTGAAASITAFATPIATITGLTGMTAASRGRFLTMTGAGTPSNNGTFLITEFVSLSSVKVANASAVAPDANNGTLSWIEREPYTLEDDLNFERTDRAAIKGVAYDAAIPMYDRPTAVGTLVPANLANINAKTLDAHAKTFNKRFLAQVVAATNTFITVSSVGNLKHATATDRTGVPIQDGADVGAHAVTYVRVTDPITGNELEVLGGADEGKRIFGRTRAGASTSPDSVEVEFRAATLGADITTSVAYTWEALQPTSINLEIGFRKRLDQIADEDFRLVGTVGLATDADLRQDVEDIRDVIDTGLGNEATSLAGLLTNLGPEFAFSDLPDATPSVVEALNTLNAQIGDRSYTGALLTDGQTIAASLQALATELEATSVVRIIERPTVDLLQGTPHTLPGGAAYTTDGSHNGQNLWLFWHGILRHPGPTTFPGNEYEETSPTSFTAYSKIKADSCIDYFILQ